MEEMVVKTESNGEILLFYVDENGGNEQGVVTTIQNIEEGQLEDPQQETYILEEVDDTTTEIETDLPQQENQPGKDRWLDGEVKRLLIFYIDNKETFLSGLTKKRHLWTVACKTMLTSKRPISCDMKIRNLRRKYAQICVDELRKRGNEKNTWPYYDLCHQAFHDDGYVKMFISEDLKAQEPQIMKVPAANVEREGTVVIKKVNSRQIPDNKVEQMLKLYMKHKKQTPKEYWQKHIWEKIAIELGEDSDYWHKRYLNYKNHYIKMLERRAEPGNQTITWPYMQLFDKIYKDDEDFKKKQTNINVTPIQYSTENDLLVPLDWDETEKTVLVKYRFDCFDEFQDDTIPDGFLWHEVERLLDKPMDTCRAKYEELRSNHLDLYISGGYTLQHRKPIAILFDNLISKEIELGLSVTPKQFDQVVSWKYELIDDLVHFFLNNIELFKDMICHFVCWAAVSKMLCQSVRNCRDQWRDLTSLYKSILDDKKENPEMQIDWRYTDLFDRIFDYGMDTNLLEGYEKEVEIKEKSRNIGVKKLKLKEEDFSENELDDEYNGKGSSGTGDPKQLKILEYYQKNKTKFTKSQHKKNTLWEALAKQIGLTSGQCASSFRNLKQMYTSYVQREINKPEKPILWPYYAQCKKVFGYRAIQNKLKSGKDSDEGNEWSNKEIKQLIDYVAKNFDVINSNIDNITCWNLLSNDISKSSTSCRDKFLELRKYYRQLKAMKERNKGCNVMWKYYKKFDDIYAGENEGSAQGGAMDVDDDYDSVSEDHQLVGEQLVLPEGAIKTELHEVDDDYQCIIVVPEGQELSGIENAQIIIKEPTQPKQKPKPEKTTKWTKKSKTKLLELYLDYIQNHMSETIKTREMWIDIAKKIPGKSPFLCKDTYMTMRRQNSQDKDRKTPYTDIFDKISALKPKFWKCPTYEELVSQEAEIKDVSLPDWKVEKALRYYLQHIEEFLNPKYEKKYAWLELANHVDVPVARIYMKIHYLKQFYDSETNKVADKKVEYGDLIKEILEKEFVVRIAMAAEPQPMAVEENTEIVNPWSDEETESLLNWYLENLETFKNPKFVPSYLWMDASILLNKTALECSKKMSEIRTQYSNMMKENPDALSTWRYHELCQKIYGTGKKGTPVNSD